MSKYAKEICFDSLPGLIILIVGTYYDMLDLDEKFPRSNNSSFNPEKFTRWVAIRHTVKISAYVEKNVPLFNFARTEAFRLNQIAKHINKYYSREEMTDDYNNGNIVPFIR